MDKPLSFVQGYQHIMLVGPPGSGKSQFSNILAQLYGALCIVADVNTVNGVARVNEKFPSDFIAGYVGQTAPQTRDVLVQSLEKVLFIDEAYGLTETGSGKSSKDDSYGHEAVNEIVAFLSTHVGQMIVIAAGYKEEMVKFRTSNVGLARRIPRV
ncbi:P-loop containing nucleoside triphosphate hydrolase protein, partial [Tribonema minus]